MESFSRLAQASSSLIPVLYSCCFRISFLSMEIWNIFGNRAFHFCAETKPMHSTKPFGITCLKLCFPQKTLFSSELYQKGERMSEHSYRISEFILQPFLYWVKGLRKLCPFLFFFGQGVTFAKEEWDTTKGSHRRAHYFLNPAMSWRKETEQASCWCLETGEGKEC